MPQLIDQLYTLAERKKLQELRCSRTLPTAPETVLAPADFCQPIDIAISLTGNSTAAIANMDGYPMRSAENAVEYISELKEKGIGTVMLRMDAPSSLGGPDAVIARQAATLQTIRNAYTPEDLTIIVDPFSVALNPDKTWGVQKGGKLDYIATANLFAELTKVFANAGGSYILTLGRFEREVDIAARSITHAGAEALVSSFSTNTETTNAYVYADHGAYALTNQKIPVSNSAEMVLRALIDIHEGSRLVIIKPAENLHIVERLTALLGDGNGLGIFFHTDEVQAAANASPYVGHVVREIADDTAAFLQKAAEARLGTYTVSGTYFIDRQTLARRGDDFLVCVLYERFCNSKSVLQRRQQCGYIIDRNAHWYFTHRT